MDRGAFVSIYNVMLRPPRPMTSASFDYARDKFFYSRDLAGIHFQFLQIWPDSGMRGRMSADLAHVDPDTPVIVFTHDQPDVEAKHFINPNGAHDINAADRFENLLGDQFADGPTADRRAPSNRASWRPSWRHTATSPRTSTATPTGTRPTSGTVRTAARGCTSSEWIRR